MRVYVEFLGEVSKLAGKTSLWIELPEESTLETLFSKIHEIFGREVYQIMVQKFNNRSLFVFINGISATSMDHKIKNMDKISFASLAYGG
ncbi:MAG: hypothetical protein QXJ69_07420 [Desulfurococcaceae archaeon]